NDASGGLDQEGVDEDAVFTACVRVDTYAGAELDGVHASTPTTPRPRPPCHAVHANLSWPETMRDPFDGIIVFVQVATARSFGEAGRRLGVTTSAVSKALARLETEVGAGLLQRSARAVTLTTEGTAFLE